MTNKVCGCVFVLKERNGSRTVECYRRQTLLQCLPYQEGQGRSHHFGSLWQLSLAGSLVWANVMVGAQIAILEIQDAVIGIVSGRSIFNEHS